MIDIKDKYDLILKITKHNMYHHRISILWLNPHLKEYTTNDIVKISNRYFNELTYYRMYINNSGRDDHFYAQINKTKNWLKKLKNQEVKGIKYLIINETNK